MNKLTIFVTLLLVTATSSISAYYVQVLNYSDAKLKCIIHRRESTPLSINVDPGKGELLKDASTGEAETGIYCIYGVTITPQLSAMKVAQHKLAAEQAAAAGQPAPTMQRAPEPITIVKPFASHPLFDIPQTFVGCHNLVIKVYNIKGTNQLRIELERSDVGFMQKSGKETKVYETPTDPQAIA